MSAAEEKKHKTERKSQLPILGVHRWKKMIQGIACFIMKVSRSGQRDETLGLFIRIVHQSLKSHQCPTTIPVWKET